MIHVLASVLIIALVLLQQGKGADLGASFGAGASQSVFGSQGAGSFLSRVTAYAVAVFFATSLGLTYYTHKQTAQTGIVDQYMDASAAVPVDEEVPVGKPNSDVPRS